MNEKRLLEVLETHYGIEAPSLELLREGGGHTYIVNGETIYLLKVIGSAFRNTARQSISIMRYLEENNFPVPGIILTKDGNTACETTVDGEETLIVLMEFIDGDEPDLKECASEVGALVGRFHQLMDQYPAEPVSHSREFFIRGCPLMRNWAGACGIRSKVFPRGIVTVICTGEIFCKTRKERFILWILIQSAALRLCLILWLCAI